MLEDRLHCCVFLQINAADASAAVVEIEVAGNLRILRLEFDRACRFSVEFGEFEFIGSTGARNESEVLLYVVVGSELAFLLAGPKCDANGAARLHLQCVEYTHDFHGDDRSGAVIRCTCRGGPRIEMSADHHDLVFQLRVRSGNFRNGVEAVLVVTGELGIDIHLNRYRHVRFEQAIDAPVVFDCHHCAGDRACVFAAIYEPAKRGSGVVEESAAGATIVTSVAAGD